MPVMKLLGAIFLFSYFILQCESLLESSFPLTVLPLHYQTNRNDSQRIYYSDKSVIKFFRHSGYIPVNSSLTTSSFGLATPDSDCEVIDTLCPQLTQIYHVNVNGFPRLVSWNELKDNDTMEIVEEAGYVGPWPGYCGTSNGALVELFSPILNAFKYATSNEDILKARWNVDRQFWRPTSILGYLFNATEPTRTVHYPFNEIRPLDNIIFNKILLRLRPILRFKNSDGLTAFTTNFHNSKYLPAYKLDKVLNISLIDESTNMTIIQDACGKTKLVYEFQNSNTRTYRFKMVFDDADDEFQNPEKKSNIEYASSPEEIETFTVTKKWTNLGLMGYTSWGNFAFAKR